MGYYCKKPVTITAYQTQTEMVISTLNGDVKASPGDYVITGVKGERYPCKSDIFHETYVVAPTPPYMDFGGALDALRDGKRVKRSAWGGCWFIPQAETYGGELVDPATGLCRQFRFNPMIVACLRDNGGYVPATPYQEDLLANDWVVVD